MISGQFSGFSLELSLGGLAPVVQSVANLSRKEHTDRRPEVRPTDRYDGRRCPTMHRSPTDERLLEASTDPRRWTSRETDCSLCTVFNRGASVQAACLRWKPIQSLIQGLIRTWNPSTMLPGVRELPKHGARCA